MAAIIPSFKIDADAKLSKYFLPYQLAWIRDEARMRFAEKSVRIGWTYADAFKNVRKRLQHKNRDYLFATKDQASAVEYMQTCMKFVEIFDFTRSVVSKGEDSVKFDNKNEKGESFRDEVKFGYIKFDNGSRIISFSSNPYAMAVFGGDVGLDEFAKHPQAEKLWETAQGRITWGYDIGIWSAHDGTDTLFYVFAQEARAGKGGWSYYKVTMEDAVALGLVEKINQVQGTDFTREGFIQDCKNRARLPEIYEQAYNCNPQGSTSAIVPWTQMENCLRDYSIPRLHLEASEIKTLFGEFSPAYQVPRQQRIAAFLRSSFAGLFKSAAHHRLGFDVAASGQGDLAAIYVDKKESPRLALDGLFTCRTDDWDFLKTALWTFLQETPALRAAGDETGLGRQICWETAKQFPNIFTPVNFASEKHNMGFALMNQLSVAEKVFPRTQPDIAADYFAMRKIFKSGKWHFTEGRNMLNPASHCDIAWAGALATKSDSTEGAGEIYLFPDSHADRVLAARRERTMG